MRVVFDLRPVAGQLVLPLHYNSILQGLVYHLLAGTEVAAFLHDQGFTRGARRYKLFTFSRLEGAYAIERTHPHEGGTNPASAGSSTTANPTNKVIRFTGRVRLTLSSPYVPVIHAAASRALQRGALRLGTQEVEVAAVHCEELPPVTPPLTLRARTPITVYSTVHRPDGSRFTYFFEPRSGEFERLVAENLVRKWEAFTGRAYEGAGVQIRWRGRARGHVTRFRHGVIKGFTGRFLIDGDPALIALGLEAGFGSKNAQGFGLCDPVVTPQDGRGGGSARAGEPGNGAAAAADPDHGPAEGGAAPHAAVSGGRTAGEVESARQSRQVPVDATVSSDGAALEVERCADREPGSPGSTLAGAGSGGTSDAAGHHGRDEPPGGGVTSVIRV
ncbi:CRISPR-associated endoribonuclease Cas6 [Thermaerobacter composti]|uniref:CRISPR-associated endoribonuclease Cas6 n=1 Tax=Thermaerobacter composti TaxID=554949 RepID=A0ABZ0QMP0_9FIRM|nr:CRISPR-associated endoribonuclease Cas6 [Thermaerobacter composti]WPD18308.1 CRISPR-associated endoribonuclease Cas6 [Thermaerobacter composti]